MPSSDSISQNRGNLDYPSSDGFLQWRQRQLGAIRHALRTNNIQQAQRLANRLYANKLRLNQLSDDEHFELRTFQVRILAYRDIQKAIQLFSKLKPVTRQQVDYLQAALMDLQLIAGDYSSAVHTLVRSATRPDTDQESLSNRIWNLLGRATLYELPTFIEQSESETEKAWWELAYIHAAAITPRDFEIARDTWIRKNPSHLAVKFPPRAIEDAFEYPQSIALLLPLSGPIRTAATAIRDGFLAAYIASANVSSSVHQQVHIYDTTGIDIGLVVEQAILDGAKSMVGPLSKENVRRVLTAPPSIPMLALNRVENSTKHTPDASNIIQMAIAVEDDALALAQRISEEGLSGIVVLRGSDAWTARAAQAFVRFLDNQDSIIDFVEFDEVKNITKMIGDSFRTEVSMARHEKLEQITYREMSFVPRRRRDMDGIVAFINATEFDTLVAAIQFHFAHDLPLFVTSAALRSRNLGDNADGTMVPVIPWQVYYTTNQARIRNAFPPAREEISLYALGFDAYRLINWWNLLQSRARISGGTGLLTLNPDGIISRSLVWGQVEKGEIVPVQTQQRIITLN